MGNLKDRWLQTIYGHLKSAYFCEAVRVISWMLATAITAFAADFGQLQVRIYETDRGTLSSARVNVIGSDHAFYEPAPANNPLAQFSLKRSGNRSNVGPVRYYGSFFYTDGSFSVSLPPGSARVEVWKGYSYYPSVVPVNVSPGQTTSVDVTLQRAVHMPRYGWTSADVHLHPDRASSESDRRLMRVMAAEDVELGYISTGQTAKGYGMPSLHTEGRLQIVTGREIVTPNLGHINFFMIARLIPMLRDSPQDPGTALATIYDQVRALKGAMQHNHGGYGMEIYSDVVLGKSDWVELGQFGGYRPLIGEEGYYHLLNSGFRYPLAGGSDWPANRVFADSRSYVADGPNPTFPTGTGRLLDGQSFATSGPLLFLSVDGKGPGSDIELTGTGPRQLPVVVKAISADFPLETVEIIQDGKVLANWRGAEGVYQKELKVTATVNASSWIAARCSVPAYSHAHTNPVWIYRGGLAPFRKEALTEVLRRINAFENPQLSPEVRSVVASARKRAEQILAAGTAPPRPPLASIDRFPVGPSGTILFPEMMPRPKPMDKITVEGSVVNSEGQPLAGAVVSANALNPPVRTGANGSFALRGIDTARPLFIRVTNMGYATTNTPYLNPWAPKENLRIMVLKDEQVKSMLTAWGAGDRGGPNRAVVVLDSAAGNGEPISGLQMSTRARGTGAWPADVPQFGYADANGGFAAQASTMSRRAGVQVLGLIRIMFQPASPEIPNTFEPNAIISVAPLGTEVVVPAFDGHVVYGVIRGR